jgi:hypothetical protein
LTSKYDGDGIKKYGRPKCKLVIVLDISGSMSDIFYSKKSSSTSKLETAKSVLKSMINQISPSDFYSLVLFDTVADIVYPLTKFSEIDKDML